MTKKVATITILVLSILLVSLYTITSTYSVIINVIEKDGKNEIINNITIKDILTDDYGNYNDAYYRVKNELDITPEEADILMESIPLNDSLQIVLNNIVDYKLNNKDRLTDNEIYSLIELAVNEDNNINKELGNKIITKSKTYIKDITDYIYDIDIKKIEETLWYI